MDSDRELITGETVSADDLAAMMPEFFGDRLPPVTARPDEGSVTRLVNWGGRERLVSFNDTTRLGRRPRALDAALEQGLPVVALIRHGRTAANLAGRWQGSMDDVLDEIGEKQAAALHSTPSHHPDLVELNFGKWEGLTTEEIRATGGLFDQIFVDGSDHPRGETGETWALLERRMRKALKEIEPAAGKITGVVTHGAAIRAVITSLADGGWQGAVNLLTPANTSVTHLVMGDNPTVVDYGLAPHLDDSLR